MRTPNTTTRRSSTDSSSLTEPRRPMSKTTPAALSGAGGDNGTPVSNPLVPLGSGFFKRTRSFTFSTDAASTYAKRSMMNVMGGMIFGFIIAMVAVTIPSQRLLSYCPNFTTGQLCAWRGSGCVWNSEIDACQFSAVCPSMGREECLNNPKWCSYSVDDDDCKHIVGWSPIEVGVFASAAVFGGLLGSLLAGTSTLISRTRDIRIAGLIVFVGLVVGYLSWNYQIWHLGLVVSRIVVGLGVGELCVLCPLYVSENVPTEVRPVLGALFQIFVTFGIFASAILGYVMHSNAGSVDVQHYSAMVLVLFLEAAVHFQKIGLKRNSSDLFASGSLSSPSFGPRAIVAADGGRGDEAHDHTSYCTPWKSKYLTMAIFLSAAQQLSGINAIMNYAPSIAEASGLSPSLSNMLIMLWNFLATLISLPLSSHHKSKVLYTYSLIAVVGSSFLIAFPLLFLSAHGTVAQGLIVSGIFLFIGAFEFGMGPMFFVLATEIFPPSMRDRGTGFVNVTQFMFNLIVNFAFPPLVSMFSSMLGSSGSEKGTGATFVIFGCTGLLCWLFLRKHLSRYQNFQDPSLAAAREKTQRAVTPVKQSSRQSSRQSTPVQPFPPPPPPRRRESASTFV